MPSAKDRGHVNDLSCLTDALNAELERRNARDERSARGQFLTPPEAAQTMAALVEPAGSSLKVLDPGAGAGALMLALVAHLIMKGDIERLSIDLVETDPKALELLETALHAAHSAADAHGLQLTARIIDADFCDTSAWANGEEFDVAILNPPYMKLGASDPCRRIVRRCHGPDCPNMYAAFVTVALALLRNGGQMVAVTPRSFANGSYFKSFRRYITDIASFRRVVLFDRRDRIFRTSSVLQETVIFLMHKTPSHTHDLVKVETRLDHLSKPEEVCDVPHRSVVMPNDAQRFINLPSSFNAMSVASKMAALPADMRSLDLSVSTGPVVDFRYGDFLSKAYAKDTVPLIYPGNLKSNGVKWPLNIRKPQGLIMSQETSRLLLPNGHYVLIKRFTAKEERRRIVASLYHPIDGYEFVAFENHLNVIHRGHGPLTRDEAQAPPVIATDRP